MAFGRKRQILMQKNLVIVFAKNKMEGKVKTRLAAAIGNRAALEIYEYLFHLTERETEKIATADIHVYFTHFLDETVWSGVNKFIQEGENLGERMKRAFDNGFKEGYERIIGIGADLPDLTVAIIEKAFEGLDESDFVFGPAQDGGYYLVGMNSADGLYVFENKPWSTKNLLSITLSEIKAKNRTIESLLMLNDIDTIEDLKDSSISERFHSFMPAKG